MNEKVEKLIELSLRKNAERALLKAIEEQKQKANEPDTKPDNKPDGTREILLRKYHAERNY